jgi:hypothetical protein
MNRLGGSLCLGTAANVGERLKERKKTSDTLGIARRDASAADQFREVHEWIY